MKFDVIIVESPLSIEGILAFHLQKYESFPSKIVRDEFDCSGSRENLYKLVMSFNYLTTISPYRKTYSPAIN